MSINCNVSFPNLALDSGEMEAANLCLIQVATKAFYSAVFELVPDVETFHHEVYSAKSWLSCSDHPRQTVVKRLLSLLEALRSQIFQIKTDVAGMRADVKEILVTVKAESSPPVPDGALLKDENTDDQVDSLDNSCSSNPGPDGGERTFSLSECVPSDGRTFSQSRCVRADGRTFSLSECVPSDGRTFSQSSVRADGRTFSLSECVPSDGRTFSQSSVRADGRTFSLSECVPADGRTFSQSQCVRADGRTFSQSECVPADGRTFSQSQCVRADGRTFSQSECVPSDGRTFSQSQCVPADGRTFSQSQCVPSDGRTFSQSQCVRADGRTFSQSECVPADGRTFSQSECVSADDSIEMPAASTPIPTTKIRKCHICHKNINHRSYHMQKYHPGEKCFPCKLCDEAFNDFKEFQAHRRTHNGSRLFHCDLCNRTLKSRQAILEHVRSHKGYPCGVCGKSFRNKISLATCTHDRPTQETSDMMKYRSGFQCKTCGTHFASLDHLHQSIEDNQSLEGNSKTLAEEKGTLPCMHQDVQKTFFCNFCPKAYSTGRVLRRHMNLHTGVKLYTCDVCHEKFYTCLERKKHMYEKHNAEFPGYRCNICGEMCRSIMGRETHYMTHTPEERSMHNIVIKMAECDICGKTVRRHELANHKLVHASDDSFICEVCGKGFRRKAYLQRHVLGHMKVEDRPIPRSRFSQPRQRRPYSKPHPRKIFPREKIHQCDICSKRFATRQSLQNHEVVHTKKKDFKCDVCGMAFSLERNLKRHYIVHTGEKPFQCDFCGKGFTQKGGLDIHRRIHTGDKPYQCNQCGRRFSDPSTLYKHRSKHEKDLVYTLKSL